MMRLFRWITFCLLVMGISASRAGADVSAEERQRAFAWFDTLGYPDVSRLPLGKVSYDVVERPLVSPEEELQRMLHRPEFFALELPIGFPAQSDLAVDLFTLNLQPLPSRVSAGLRAHFEPIDLKTYVEQVIKWQAEPNMHLLLSAQRGPVELFVLARACEGHKLSALSAQLCNMAEKTLPFTGENGRQLISWQAKIADAIGLEAFWKLRGHFQEPAIARSDLLNQCERFLSNFPDSLHCVEVGELQAELKRMVAEERQQRGASVLPQRKVSQQQKIAALIFSLCDQSGRTVDLWTDHLFMSLQDDQSPTSQLLTIGFPAVPALLEALTDTRLTHSLAYNEENYHRLDITSIHGLDEEWYAQKRPFSVRILRVGDAAQEILQNMANQLFEGKRSYISVNAWKKDALIVQREARAWWEKGQAQQRALGKEAKPLQP